MNTAVACIAILGGLLFGLGFNVSRLRAARGPELSQFPTDPADSLLKAIRAHGNASEYIPTLAILMLVVATRRPAAWTAALMIGATAARLLHAYALIAAPSLAKNTKPRLVGALGTYLFGLALAITAATTL
jgi:uncharacterized membrane protein YecN with MAPEG domain